MDPIFLLVVEDDPGVREILQTELTEAGFRIVTVSNGTEAITQLEEKAARLRAIITDIRLGTEPDGWEVARRARELIPDIPVIYATGDSTHEWDSRGVPKSVLIEKPFSPAQLTTAVSTLLNEADTNRAR